MYNIYIYIHTHTLIWKWTNLDVKRPLVHIYTDTAKHTDVNPLVARGIIFLIISRMFNRCETSELLRDGASNEIQK